MPWPDRWSRPTGRAATPTRCSSSAPAGRSSPPPPRTRSRPSSPNAMVVDGYGASETGVVGTGDGRRSRFTVDDETSVLDDDGHPVQPGSGADRPAGPTRPHPARLLRRRGQDGGDVPDGRRGALGVPRRHGDRRGGRHGRAARTRLGEHQHGRREGLPRRGRDGAEEPSGGGRRRGGGRARRAVGRAGGGGGRADWRPPRRSRTCRPCAAIRSPATRFPAAWCWWTTVVRSPAGKADYRWAKAQAVEQNA